MHPAGAVREPPLPTNVATHSIMDAIPNRSSMLCSLIKKRSFVEELSDKEAIAPAISIPSVELLKMQL
jgi:hypothetical protein